MKVTTIAIIFLLFLMIFSSGRALREQLIQTLEEEIRTGKKENWVLMHLGIY